MVWVMAICPTPSCRLVRPRKLIRSTMPGPADNTRHNSSRITGVCRCGATPASARALAAGAGRTKARGFSGRSALLMLGGLPMHELDEIDAKIVRLTTAEKDLVSSWHTPTSIARSSAPPGRGKFLVKVANRPGIPVQVLLTDAERVADVHNTDKRWAD